MDGVPAGARVPGRQHGGRGVMRTIILKLTDEEVSLFVKMMKSISNDPGDVDYELYTSIRLKFEENLIL